MMRLLSVMTQRGVGLGLEKAAASRARVRAWERWSSSWDAKDMQDQDSWWLVEQGVDEGGGVEGDDVLELFADAGVADREAELVGDGDDDAAFGAAVELGEDDTGDVGGLGEEACLLQTVLAGGCVDDEEGLVRSAGQEALGGAAHLVELLHEVGLGVEAAGGVDEKDASVAGLGGGEGVEERGGGIATLARLDEVDVGALGPDFELLDGSGAEGIG